MSDECEELQGAYAYVLDHVDDIVIKIPKMSMNEDIVNSAYSNITETAVMAMMPENVNVISAHKIMHTSNVDDIIMPEDVEMHSFSILMKKGITLRELRDKTSPSERMSMWPRLAIDLLLGVRALSRHGIIHCDIKLDNIVAFKSSSTDARYNYKLIDLGMARFMHWGEKYDINEMRMMLHMRPPEYRPSRISKPLINVDLDVYCVGTAVYEFVYGDMITDEDIKSVRTRHSKINCVADLFNSSDDTIMTWVSTIINKKISLIEDTDLKTFMQSVIAHPQAHTCSTHRPSVKTLLLNMNCFRSHTKYITHSLDGIDACVPEAKIYEPVHDCPDMMSMIVQLSANNCVRHVCHAITMAQRYVDAGGEVTEMSARAINFIVSWMLNSHADTLPQSYADDVSTMLECVRDISEFLNYKFYHFTIYEINRIQACPQDTDDYITQLRAHYT